MKNKEDHYEQIKPIVDEIDKTQEVLDMLHRCNKAPGSRLALTEVATDGVGNRKVLDVSHKDNIEDLLIVYYNKKKELLLDKLNTP